MSIRQPCSASTAIMPVRPGHRVPRRGAARPRGARADISALCGAEAASIETAVATVHPDWPPEKVAAEVARIYAEINVDMLSRARIAVRASRRRRWRKTLSSIRARSGQRTWNAQVETVANAGAQRHGCREHGGGIRWQQRRPRQAAVIKSPGKKPISFQKGGLHQSLGVPQGQPIPAAKMQQALSGKAGPNAQKQAQFAKNVLGKGQKTAAANRASAPSRKGSTRGARKGK